MGFDISCRRSGLRFFCIGLECCLVGIMGILRSGLEADSVMPGLDHLERVQ